MFYLWKNNITIVPKCPVCGKTPHFETGQIYCCHKCSYIATEDQLKETCLQRYGTEYTFQSEKVKQKSKETCLKKYGKEFSIQSNEIKNKRKQNTKEKYGVESTFQLSEVKEKSKQTSLDKYGTEYAMQSQETQNKRKQTCLKKYGTEFSCQSESVKQKSKETCLKNYGVEFIFQSSIIQEKRNKNNKEKYGVECLFQLEQIKNDLFFLKRQKRYNSFIEQLKNSEYKLLSTKEEFCTKRIIKYQHSCGNIFETEKTNLQILHCPKCSENSGTSEKEKVMVEFIKSLYNEQIIENDRTLLNGKELDIYIPEYNLAIEFNGNYWHSLKDKTYHQEKTLKCKELGI